MNYGTLTKERRGSIWVPQNYWNNTAMGLMNFMVSFSNDIKELPNAWKTQIPKILRRNSEPSSGGAYL